MPSLFIYALSFLGVMVVFGLVLCMREERQGTSAKHSFLKAKPKPAALPVPPAAKPAGATWEEWSPASPAITLPVASARAPMPLAAGGRENQTEDLDALRQEVRSLRLALAETDATLAALKASLAPAGRRSATEPRLPDVNVFALPKKRTV